MSSQYSDQHGFDPSELTFQAADIASHLESLTLTDLGLLRFGVIGVNESGTTTRYNLRESSPAGRPTRQVVGHPIAEALAPLLNAAQVCSYLTEKIGSKQRHDEIFTCDLLYPVGAQVKIRMVCSPTIKTKYLLLEH